MPLLTTNELHVVALRIEWWYVEPVGTGLTDDAMFLRETATLVSAFGTAINGPKEV